MNFAVKKVEFEFPEREKREKGFLHIFNKYFEMYASSNSFEDKGNSIEFKKAISLNTLINVLGKIDLNTNYSITEIEYEGCGVVEVEVEMV